MLFVAANNSKGGFVFKIKGDSRDDDEYVTAGRFYPSIHAWIVAASLQYQPERVTFAQVKAIALLQSGALPFFTCRCGDFASRAAAVAKAISLAPLKIATETKFDLGDGGYAIPNFMVRLQDVPDAVKLSKSYLNYVWRARLILSCGWGLFLMPGLGMEEIWGEDLIANWNKFAVDPAYQCAVFMQVFDKLLKISGDDFEKAASMFYAGHQAPTISTFGKQASKTLNRLLAAGHRAR